MKPLPKINKLLNSLKVIDALISLNSSINLYFSNSRFQDFSVNGNKIPLKGCHSVIDKPEFDILVTSY